MRCVAKALKDKQCKFEAESGTNYCRIHIKQRPFIFNKVKNDTARTAWKAWCKSDHMVCFPEVCRGLICGAKTRAGSPCKRTNLCSSGMMVALLMGSLKLGVGWCEMVWGRAVAKGGACKGVSQFTG